MSAHRYWRINLTSVPAGNNVSADNIQFRATPGGANLATNPASASASSGAASGPGAPSCAVEGQDSYWAVNAGAPCPQWWAYDFGGTPQEIQQVSIQSRPDGYFQQYSPSGFDVQCSDDGSSWTTLVSYTGVAWSGASQAQVFAVPVPGGAFRYWRLANMVSTFGNNVSFAEAAFAAAAGGASLCTGGTPSASSEDPRDGGRLASMAVDNNLSTFWSATDGETTSFWQYLFSAAQSPQELRITARTDAYPQFSPAQFDIQYSADGAAWTTATHVATPAWNGGETRAFPIPAIALGPSAPARRYWRIATAAATDNRGYFSMAEVQFRAVPGTAQPFGPGTASASAALDATYVPGNAADNNLSTLWAASSDAPQWWQWDYGAGGGEAVAEVAITARGDAYPFQTPSVFVLQWSNDGASWTTAASFVASAWSAGQTQLFAVPPPAAVPTALQFLDRVRVTTATIGMGDVTIGAAVAGCQDFSAMAAGRQAFYCLEDGPAWETGFGTLTASGTWSRTAVSASSNGGQLISLSGNAQLYLTWTAGAVTSAAVLELLVAGLPTTKPGAAGHLWINAGALSVS